MIIASLALLFLNKAFAGEKGLKHLVARRDFAIAHQGAFSDAIEAEFIQLQKVLKQKIVRFKHGVAREVQEKLIHEANGKVIRRLPLINALVVENLETSSFQHKEEVRSIDDDSLMGVNFGNWAAFIGGMAGCAVLPQETPWGIEEVRAPEAWKYSKGEGVRVCVLDTGVDSEHPDLLERIQGGRNLFDESQSDNFYDFNGHGTYVSGIIAAEDNEVGVVGVAPKADIYMGVIAGRLGTIPTSAAIAGIEYCQEIGTKIINMSFGTYVYSESFDEAVQVAAEAGILMVAAAGNDATDEPSYPEWFANVLSVKASNSNDEFWANSNFGFSTRSLIAPGVEIFSTWPVDSSSGDREDYQTLSGTSASSPHVAGVAALLIGTYPDISIYSLLRSLESGSTDLGLSYEEQGYGLVNAVGAIEHYESWLIEYRD